MYITKQYCDNCGEKITVINPYYITINCDYNSWKFVPKGINGNYVLCKKCWIERTNILKKYIEEWNIKRNRIEKEKITD